MSILYAYTDDNKIIHIKDYNIKYKDKIYCCQGHKVIAKRGTKMKHHFCHKRNNGNDTCCREMGDWHIQSQERIKDEYIEKRIKGKNKYHIADVINKNNIVIEYQKSIISPDVIKQRDDFYKKYCKDIIWVFSTEKIGVEILKQSGNYVKLYFTGSSFFIKANNIFLDEGKRGYIKIIDKQNNIGELWSYNKFDKTYLNGILKENADKRIYRHKYKFNNNIPKHIALKNLI